MTDAEWTEFTKQAAKFWAAIPVHARAELLANVYCSQCRRAVSITNIAGSIKRGDLVLEGTCVKCGHSVARVVEGPDA